MAQLSLGVGTYELQAKGLWQPFCLLIRTGLRQQGGYEHLRAGATAHETPHEQLIHELQ